MPAEQDSFNIQDQLRHYLSLLKERWYPITVMVVIALLIGIGLAQLWPATYEATTVFSLRESQLMDESALVESMQKVRLQAKKNTFLREIRSTSRIRDVLKKLEWKEYIKAQADVTGRGMMELYQKVGDALMVEVHSEGVGDTIVTLTFEWKDPFKAASFVNTMRDLWIDLKIEYFQDDYMDRRNRAEKVVADRGKEYDEAMQELERFDEENNYAALGTVEENTRQIENFRAVVIESESTEQSTAKSIEDLEAALLDIPPILQHPRKTRNTEYAKAVVAYTNLQKLYKDKEEKWTDAHPEMQKLIHNLKEAKAKLESMKDQEFTVEGILEVPNEKWVQMSGLLDRLKTDHDLAKARKENHLQELQKYEENQRKLPSILVERDQILKDIDLKRTQYEEALMVAQRIQDTVKNFMTFQQNAGTWSPESTFRNETFEILTPASASGEPKNPMTLIILGVSLLLGFGLGLVLSLVGELLKSSFTTQEEVVSYLKRPVLGSVSPIMTESEIKAIKWRKVIFASSTLLLIFSLVAILFICNQYPQLIPHAIVEKVNEIREALG